jgi:K+-sensing histidine kinase KdpD
VERPTRDFERTSDAFIRQVAHDLRASLNVVVSWAELVKAGQLPPDDVSRAGDTIVRHARHLSERLGVALDLWRLDSGLLAPSMRVASIGAIVRAAVDDARRHFDSRRVTCRLDVRGDGSASVDAPRLAQALIVLLGDAAVNTPADQRVEVTVDADGGHMVVGIVGGGLMPAQNAFNRDVADTSGGGQRRPFDFGLALARELVELNGGVLGVEPADGGRVAMLVRLPVSDARHSTPP